VDRRRLRFEQIKAMMASQSLTGTMVGPATPGTPYAFRLHAIGRAIHARLYGRHHAVASRSRAT
jgi:hypothetical protein